MVKSFEQINREFWEEYGFDKIVPGISVSQKKSLGIPETETETETETKSADASALEKYYREKPEFPRLAVEEKESSPTAGVITKKAQYKTSLSKELLLLLLKITAILLALVMMFTFLFGLIRYSDPSMAPAIKDGDLVIFYRYKSAGYLPQDAIALDYEGKTQVRRVVAVAGDEVDITESGLIVNGALQHEPEINQKTERYADGISFPLIVPEGHVFVLGDSRVGATDSRIYGPVDIKDTLGKVMAIIRRRSI